MTLNILIDTSHQLLGRSYRAQAGNIYQMYVLKHSYTHSYWDANMQKWVALFRLKEILPNGASDSVVS